MNFSLLYKTAIGDAYGAGFEYASKEHILANNNLSGYVHNPRYDLPPAHYTDDTQMAIAVAEVIVSGREFSRQNLADSFVNCFKRDPRDAYARGFNKFLKEINDGSEFLAQIRPDSGKSGGAMRAVPVGIFPDVHEVKRLSALQAALTHDTDEGRNAAIAASLMGHYFLYNLGPKRDLGNFVEKHVPGTWAAPWEGLVGEKGWMSVRAALTAIVSNDTLSGILHHCVAFRGDVDTVAAIALGAASASLEVVDDLPVVLSGTLESGPYGRDYLHALDLKLEQKMLELRQSRP